MAITIQTDKPVAFDSPDHLHPFGTANDNSTDPIFNEALFALIPAADVRLLDIGCSGGGFVKSVLDAGGQAVGIEGSDYSKARRRAEWATIPENLFTADATAPFQLSEDGQPLRFNVITAWEFMEHIADEDLDGVFDNIKRHLAPQGIVIVSVCPFSCLHTGERSGEGVELHQTAQPESWWRRRLADAGFVLADDIKSCFTNFVRGWPHEPDSPVLLFTTPRIREIPKIFHQVWLGGAPFPADARAYQESWRRHHPDWEWRLWTEKDLPEFESQWALDHAAHLSQKSDVIRYEVLRRYGGVYLDTDVECRRSIGPLLEGVTAFAGRERGELMCGAVLGGIAGHPLFDALVRGLPEAMRAYTQCIEQAGPVYLSRTAYQIPGVTVFPPDVFYPYAWDEPHRQAESFADSYAVHHWRGTWKLGGDGRALPAPSAGAPAPAAPLANPYATETIHAGGRTLEAFPRGRHAAFQADPAKVSVCLSVFGGGTNLRRCVQSVQDQTFDDFQLLILDNSPATFPESASFAAEDDRVIVYRCDEASAYADGLNLCLDMAPGEYLKFVTVQETLAPDCLARLAATLDRYEHVVIARTAGEARTRSGAVQFQPPFDRTLHLPTESALAYGLTSGNLTGGLTAQIARRSVIAERGLRFDAGLRWAADYDFALRLLECGDFAYLHEAGYVTDGNVEAGRTSADRARHFAEDCRVLSAAARRGAFTPGQLGQLAERLAREYQALIGGGTLRGHTLGQILAGTGLSQADQDTATRALVGALQGVKALLTPSLALAA